jgi:hypothetical protein
MALLAVTAAAVTDPPRGAPVLTSVQPASARVGHIVTAFGEYLDRSRFTDLFLAKGEEDIQVEILQQTGKFVKFKIPAKATPGRYGLVILTPGPDPMLLMQPVWLVIE